MGQFIFHDFFTEMALLGNNLIFIVHAWNHGKKRFSPSNNYKGIKTTMVNILKVMLADQCSETVRRWWTELFQATQARWLWCLMSGLMDRLVHHCFGSNFVSVDVGDLLKEVIISYMELGLSVTLKMHVIFYHILPALSNPVLKGRGLGVMSGQAGESIHQEFKILWSKYKINSLKNKLYSESLKKAVVEFSSKHL